jgi:hypothetical protein
MFSSRAGRDSDLAARLSLGVAVLMEEVGQVGEPTLTEDGENCRVQLVRATAVLLAVMQSLSRQHGISWDGAGNG